MSETIEIVERGCGFPVQSGLYFFIGLSKYGIPAEDFLLDPLRPIPANLSIKPRGLTLIEVDGVTHILDHVGSKSYPNAADWFEEVKRRGFHQRVETTLSFHKLDRAKSRYFVTHSRVIPVKPELREIYQMFQDCDISTVCIHNIEPHNVAWDGFLPEGDTCPACVSLLWTDLIKGEWVQDFGEGEVMQVRRRMPSFSYAGYQMTGDTEYEPGFFASFPISMMRGIVYEGEGMDDNVARARENGWSEEIQVVSFE